MCKIEIFRGLNLAAFGQIFNENRNRISNTIMRFVKNVKSLLQSMVLELLKQISTQFVLVWTKQHIFLILGNAALFLL